MKQKMVVNVTMNGQKSRSKALTIAAGFLGVESASLKGNDKTQIEVTGDGVDPVKLTTLLRKSVGHAVLVSVSAVDGEKKEEKKDEKKKDEVKPPAPYMYPYDYQPLCFYQVVPSQHYDPCSIM